MSESLTKDEINRLCDVIRHRTGLTAQEHQVPKLSHVLDQLLEQGQYSTFDAFFADVQQKSLSSPEYKILIEILTVGESYFFRDQHQMSFLQNVWLPELIERKRKAGSRSIRIWSAGCSHGQEIYSIAIMLRTLIKDLDDWFLHLIGSDINAKSISKSIQGKYTMWSMREISEEALSKNFQVVGNDYYLQENIRKMASFFCHNLVDDSYPTIMNGTNSLDLIICRNVLLYFDDKTAGSVIRRFETCLEPGGILLLGLSDIQLQDMPSEFILKKSNNVVYFARTRDENMQKHAIKRPHIIEDTKHIIKKISEINNATATAPKAPRKISNIDTIHDLCKQEKWREVVSYAESHSDEVRNDTSILLYKAMALIHLKKLEAAMKVCQDALKINELDHQNYLLQALIFQESNKVEEAERTLRQSIFLNADFVDAHYFLGLLLLRQNKTHKGLKELRIALKKLNEQNPEQQLYLDPNINYAEFGRSLQKEMHQYENNQGECNE
ncbi:MAG: hypothetical protein K0U29_04860 [Gammaproteobacteria bacterium]|nr:hypothetical protein [Gammaproteobacteria bacterium]MCH9744247.1 hypothetical protein [Gammaproteobacteria bacterium]